VPTTTDLLALYEVLTDSRGELQSYRRLRRYTRGAPDDE
jgi:Gas vesicle synthesis protein GvpO